MDAEFAKQLNASISTARLLLEPRTAFHLDALFDLMQDAAIYRWISLKPPKSKEHLKDLWAKRETRLSPNSEEAWLNWVACRASDGRCIGVLDTSVDTNKVAANIGYIFFPEFWGNAYACESVLAMTDYLASCGVSKMLATVTFGNKASYRVLEKAGFQRGRVIPENDIIRGIKYDDIEFIRLVR